VSTAKSIPTSLCPAVCSTTGLLVR
jgi:hypothetical protein